MNGYLIPTIQQMIDQSSSYPTKIKLGKNQKELFKREAFKIMQDFRNNIDSFEGIPIEYTDDISLIAIEY